MNRLNLGKIVELDRIIRVCAHSINDLLLRDKNSYEVFSAVLFATYVVSTVEYFVAKPEKKLAIKPLIIGTIYAIANSE